MAGAAVVVVAALAVMLLAGADRAVASDTALTFTTALRAPWSAVSVTADTSAADLAAAAPTVSALFRWDASRQQWDRWERARPTLASLDRLQAGDAVWARVAADGTIGQAALRSERDVAMAAGWNLVAWTGDSALAGVVAGVLGAERLLLFDADAQRYINLAPGLLGIVDERVVHHGEVVWARRSRSARVTIAARQSLRLEIVVHRERLPDGAQARNESRWDGLRVTVDAHQAAQPLGDGVYVFDDLRAGEHRVWVGGGPDLIALSALSVQAAGEPIIVSLERDQRFVVGAATGRLISPTAEVANSVRPYGVPNPGFPLHDAIDFFLPAGATVVAPQAGVVVWAGRTSDATCTTRAIAIRGVDAGVVWLLHVDAIDVEVGDQVAFGSRVGTIVDAALDECVMGLPSHVHLTYQVLDEAGSYRVVDPEPYFIEAIQAPRAPR